MQLVAQHQDLELLRPLRAQPKHHHLEQTPGDPIRERAQQPDCPVPVDGLDPTDSAPGARSSASHQRLAQSDKVRRSHSLRRTEFSARTPPPPAPTRLDGLERPSGRKQPSRGSHPIDHLVAGPSVSVHPGKAGRPAPRNHAPHHKTGGDTDPLSYKAWLHPPARPAPGLRRGSHYSKGVDGSSPSEGLRFPPAQALFPLS